MSLSEFFRSKRLESGMKEHIRHHIIIGRAEREITIPQEVIEKTVLEDKSKVRAWREYLKLSQKDVAARLGISQAAYSQLEKPGANLRRSTLANIAKAFDVHVEQLVEP